MGLKKRNKVSAEFSMSSLTDIIFLLLIFFMLTANFVRVKPFELPKSDSQTVAPSSIAVSIDKKGKFFYNGEEMKYTALRAKLKSEVRKSEDKENAAIMIAAEVDCPFENVVRVMNVAKELKVKAILATQPNE